MARHRQPLSRPALVKTSDEGETFFYRGFYWTIRFAGNMWWCPDGISDGARMVVDQGHWATLPWRGRARLLRKLSLVVDGLISRENTRHEAAA